MKITQIVKGLVKKDSEEIEWRINHSRSLTQIDIRIRNPNQNLEYSAAELIRDVASYDPSKVNEAQLRDDMRICFAWYSTIKEGFSAIKARVKKYKFSEQDVISLAKKIYIEIEKRKREGKMKHEWNPDEMKKHSKELFEIISKGNPPQTSLVTKENEVLDSKVSTDLEESETLPIYPGSTSDKYEPLELSEFLNKWNSFVIRKPFISLVGSLANWQRTDGDIDILAKARDPSPLLEALDRAIVKCFSIGEEQMADLLIQLHQFIHTDSLFLNVKWRIERAFPEWQGRIQILDDSFSGPFTNFVELADLVSVAREEKEREEMSERKLKLFSHFDMLKPLHGRKKEEMYSIDSVIETIKSRKEDWFKVGIFVETKYDGTHIQCHKQGDRVKLITEDGTDVTKNCPTIAKECAAQKGDWIVCGEMELWKEGKHQPRADCAGMLNSKDVHPDEKYLRFNVFDVLWHDGNAYEDLHELPFSDRINYLNKIPDSEHIKKSKRILCHSEAEVRKAIAKVSKEEGSEGAYLKLASFPYKLTGRTNENIKFKNELSCEVQIVKVNIVKEAKR